MVVRIKSHWHNDESERSVDEIAGAIAFTAWRLAKDKAINLHGEDFVYQDDVQRMAVIREYLFFQIQILDRMAYTMLEPGDRAKLVNRSVLRLADYTQENSTDLFGPGDYGKDFIDALNRRSSDYAELGFTEDGPSYPFLRHLGYEIQRIMGDTEQNRWVIDQVMDRDGPEVSRNLMRAVRDLLA